MNCQSTFDLTRPAREIHTFPMFNRPWINTAKINREMLAFLLSLTTHTCTHKQREQRKIHKKKTQEKFLSHFPFQLEHSPAVAVCCHEKNNLKMSRNIFKTVPWNFSCVRLQTHFLKYVLAKYIYSENYPLLKAK